MSFRSIYEHIKANGFRDILSAKRRRIYRESQKQQKEGIHIPFEKALSYCEQVVYRKAICSECLKLGHCKKCKCKTPHIFFVEENTCSLGNWLEMLPPKEWKEFKEVRNLEIDIKV